MSFVYGGVDPESLEGVGTYFTGWPSLGGLGVQTVEHPGSDGLTYASQSRTSTAISYEIDIKGETREQVFERRDAFVEIIDPSRGPRSLIVEEEENWRYPEVLPNAEISWEQVAWRGGYVLLLRGEVTFQTVGSAAAREVTPASHTGEAYVTFTHSAGNTASYPTIEVPSGGDVEIAVNDFQVNLNGTPDVYTAHLDYDGFRFDLRDAGGTRVESLVPYMSHYDRPRILPGEEVTATSVRTDPENDLPLTVTIFPNARRI